MFSLLEGKKSYLASVGLLGLAIYQFSVSEYSQAIESLFAALAVFGVRNAIARKGM